MLKKATNQFVRLDTDTDNNSIGQGEGQGSYRYALNCRIRSSKDGNAGATENVRGNIEIQNTFLPTGINTCIGTCQDDTKGRLIFFNHNSNGYHGIYQYSEVDDSIVKVLVTQPTGLPAAPNNILKFSLDNLIISRVIGDFLIWTDGVNPQRQITLTRAITGGYVQPMIDAQISLAKQPPHFPPSFTYVKDTNKVQNYIEKRVFQFALRYLYIDNEVSTLSPYSDVAWDFLANDNTQSPYNVIQLNYGQDLVGNDLPIKANPAFRSMIKAVEILVRGSDYAVDVNGLNEIRVNNADWKKVSTITDFVEKNYTFNFYNNSNYSLLPSEEANKLYESIPIRSKAIEVKDNRLFVASNLEDYDNVEIDIALNVEFTDYGQSGTDEAPEDYDLTITDTDLFNFSETYDKECGGVDEALCGASFECFQTFEGTLLSYTTENRPDNPAIGTITATINVNSIVVTSGTPAVELFKRGYLEFRLNIGGFAGANIVRYVSGGSEIITLTYSGVMPFNGALIKVDYFAQVGSYDNTVEGETICYDGALEFESSEVSIELAYTTIEEPPAANPRRGHLKRGGSYQFGIVYFDEQNRYSVANVTGNVVINGIVQAENKAEIQFPLLMESIYNYFPLSPTPPILLPLYKRGVPRVTWQIFHQPPIWATHYAWARTMNQNQNAFLQWQIQQVLYVKQYKEIPEDTMTQKAGELDNAVLTTVVGDAIEVYISFENITFYKNVNTDSVLASWIPEPNDRLRLMFRWNPITSTANYMYDWTTEADRYDVPIKGIRGNWLIIDAAYVNAIDKIQALDLVEVYTPRLQQDTATLLYETGEIFTVINPHTPQSYHGKGFGSGTISQDQTADLPATGIFDSGDVYYRTREFVTKQITPADEYLKAYPTYVQSGGTDSLIKCQIYIEDQRISDFFYSYATDRGRVSLVLEGNKQTERFSSIRFSNKFLANTLINGLSSFEPLNEKVLPIEHGSINALRIAGKSQQDGNTMLAFMTTETLSMYINEAVIKQTGNAGQLTAIADDVIATINELQGGYGCQHPESIVGNQNFVYWFDARKGVVCRYATNGLYPISNYGVSKYMLDKSLQLKTIPNFKNKRVFGGYDFIADEYILTFANQSLPNITKETIGFYEPENRWSSFYSFTPEFYGKVGTTFISFVAGKLYVHNRDKNNYNTFYGVKYDSKIRYIMNEAPLNEKIYKTVVLKGSLSIEGTPPTETEEFWYAEKFETNLNQLSTLFPENYEKDSYPDTRIESAFYAPILKNELTPNVTDPIFNGELMRGEVLIVHLICKASKLCVLRFAQVGYLPSMGE